MLDNKVKMWLYLTMHTNISRSKLAELYKLFGSAEGILSATEQQLKKTGILTDDEVKNLIRKNDDGLDEYIHILNKNSVRVLTVECDDYPEMLRNLRSFPLVLYCRGKFIDLNKYLCIASVGSRNPTSYGKRNTYNIVKNFCREGCVLVSGMAQGIDAVSHMAAIDAGCPTVAFIATGVDIIYPKINTDIFHKVLEHGMVVSEYPLGTKPKPYYFPERNRLIAGVSKGVFISEASFKSGSAITASFAIEQGKDVFALPGSVESHLSEEPNRLIKNGAYVVTDADDILLHYRDIYAQNIEYGNILSTDTQTDREEADEIFVSDTDETLPEIPDNISDEEKVETALRERSLDIDSISKLTKISLSDLDVLLLTMEMDGKIKNDNGSYNIII